MNREEKGVEVRGGTVVTDGRKEGRGGVGTRINGIHVRYRVGHGETQDLQVHRK